MVNDNTSLNSHILGSCQNIYSSIHDSENDKINVFVCVCVGGGVCAAPRLWVSVLHVWLRVCVGVYVCLSVWVRTYVFSIKVSTD